MTLNTRAGSLSVIETRRILSELIKQLIAEEYKKNGGVAKETIQLEDAVNRILAEDLLSPMHVPNADNSAMDGYAFKGDNNDSSNAEQKKLKIVGTAFAGTPYLGLVISSECRQDGRKSPLAR